MSPRSYGIALDPDDAYSNAPHLHLHKEVCLQFEPTIEPNNSIGASQCYGANAMDLEVTPWSYLEELRQWVYHVTRGVACLNAPFIRLSAPKVSSPNISL